MCTTILPIHIFWKSIYNKIILETRHYEKERVLPMELSKLGLQNKADWEAKGYKLPQFDREAVTAATKENPLWIHF